jgi:hypothetical protein
MTRRLATELFGWGTAIWLVGYALGIILFAFAPPSAIGWIIMPFGVGITWWVLMRRVHEEQLGAYVAIAIGWTAIAVICDYLFIVKAFHPTDGYYKLDVYAYYVVTLALPLVAARLKTKQLRHAV